MLYYIMNNTTFISQEIPIKFCCEKCDYKCMSKGDFNKHLQSKKHNTTNTTNIQLKNSQMHKCSCGKEYEYRASLFNHKKKCVPHTETPQEELTHSLDDMQVPTNLIFELIKQNQEFKQLLIDQNKIVTEQNKQLYEKHEENIDLQKQLLDVVKDGKTINNTINNSHSNNKTFNLQFFLNETCKDAMNMKDFIKSLELSMFELERMGEIGFAEGVSKLFVDRLNSLDITKRPIHCSDVKREIIHIKDDNKWERDNANLDRLRKIIKQITHKNILKVDDWKKANPGCTEYNSRKNDQYLKLTMEAIGPVDEDEVKRDFGKIIRRVAENTFIDKKYLCV
jgi:hypothetical protein